MASHRNKKASREDWPPPDIARHGRARTRRNLAHTKTPSPLHDFVGSDDPARPHQRAAFGEIRQRARASDVPNTRPPDGRQRAIRDSPKGSTLLNPTGNAMTISGRR
jgi:hypothetical protein